MRQQTLNTAARQQRQVSHKRPLVYPFLCFHPLWKSKDYICHHRARHLHRDIYRHSNTRIQSHICTLVFWYNTWFSCESSLIETMSALQLMAVKSTFYVEAAFLPRHFFFFAISVGLLKRRMSDSLRRMKAGTFAM